MHRADKAVLRLAIGVALAVLLAYGLALPMAFMVCVVAVMLLCSPQPPAPLAKGIITALIVSGVVMSGILMVPVHEHAPVIGVLLTGALLFAVFFAGARKPTPMTAFLVVALTFIPVAGVAEQALATALAVGIGLGLGVGALVNGISHAFFPDPPEAARAAPPPANVGNASAHWQALQATVVVMPVIVLALTNPAHYLAATMKTVNLAQQASATAAGDAGRELVGSTIMGALMAAAVWAGLTLLPNLWMLVLWITAAALWAGARLFRVKPSRYPPSYWLNALMTMLILLGPAIEDAQVGKDPYAASATRVALFILASIYAWATVWVLERWRSSRALRLTT